MLASSERNCGLKNLMGTGVPPCFVVGKLVTGEAARHYKL